MSDSQPSPHILVGLTGNIATGKSAVLRLAAERGAFTIDADAVVHDLMNDDVTLQAALAVAFGEDVRRDDGRIDRRRLGALVFEDDDAMADLESIVLPAVRRELRRRIDAAPPGVVMLEAIHLIRGHWHKVCDQVWVTRCHRQRQLDRLVICRGLDPADALRRVEMQEPQEAKVAHADVVIDTDSTLAATEAQFERAWARLPAEVGEAAPPVSVDTPAASQPTRPAPVSPPTSPADRPPADPNAAVRRARPGDIPALLLVIHNATAGKNVPTRAEMMLALSERSYLIGQSGTEISTVFGWTADNNMARIEQMYVHPPEGVWRTGPALLAEIQKSADELLCEGILAFPPLVAPATLTALFRAEGYAPVPDVASLPRMWRTAVAESQPPETLVLLKKLRSGRIA